MIFRIFHLFSPPLDTFVIAGEISKSRVFFDTPCIPTRERIPSPAIACCACGQVSREKWKNARAREIKASRSFARVNDRVCHDFNLLFFSLSLPLPPSFFLSFLFLYIYIYMYTDIMRSMCSMRYRVFSLFVQWLAVHTLYNTLYAHLVERIFNERLNSFMVYLQLLAVSRVGEKLLLSIERISCVERKACEKVVSLSLGRRVVEKVSLAGIIERVKRF